MGGGGITVGQAEQTGTFFCRDRRVLDTDNIFCSTPRLAIEGSTCMCACVCLGTQGPGRPQDLMQSVGSSRFHTRFHLGFPKSSIVQMSSYSLSTSPGLSLKNKLTVCASCKDPAGKAWEVSRSTHPFSEKLTGAQRGGKAK